MELDEGQRRVLALEAGRHRVLAPPGSGKTELLSRRVERAVGRGVKPGRMACLTFTNRAARSMTARVPPSCRGVFVGNFHAFGISFLRRRDLFPIGQSVLDEEDGRAFLEAAVAAALGEGRAAPRAAEETPSWGGPAPAFTPPFAGGRDRNRLAGLLGLYADWRRQVGFRFPRWVTGESARLLRERLAEQGLALESVEDLLALALERYLALKAESFAIDYDDILNLTLHHLEEDRRRGRRPPCDWVQVDEAQDLNAIQWAILEALAVPAAHLVVLGDLQQSIYAFRGGAYRLLLERTAGFTEHHLDRNYRSPAYLLDFHRAYARLNLGKEAAIEATDDRPRGEKDMLVLACRDREQESAYLCERVVPRLLETAPGESLALLVRTNADARALSSDLYHRGVEHFTVSRYDIFQTRNGKDFMSLLTVLRNPHARFAWLRILHLFGRTRTLREARQVLNELFAAALSPLVFLGGQGLGGSGSLPELARRVEEGRVVIFDTETTGLDTERDDIIQIAALELVRGEPGREFDLYLRTDKELGESEQIHRISAVYLAEHGRDRREVLQTFLDFVGDDPLVAHNLEYDWTILQANLGTYGAGPMDPAHPRFCSLFAARSLYPQAPRHRLAAMLEFLALPGVNSHNAIDDVRATVGLVRRMAQDFHDRRGEAEAVLDRHGTLFRRFTDNFKPLWDTFQERRGEPWSFAEIHDRWRERLERDFSAYPRTHLEEVKGKIVRHMEHTARPAPLPTLLRRHLPRYALYREPDLILEEDRLVVSTVHRAKGLEFDRVILPFCVDGRFPLFLARDEEARAEEARLLYVACTRARRGLILSWHHTYKGREMALSPYIAGLEQEHFRSYEITSEHFRPAARPIRCPRCGHRFLHDGSRQKNRRCFECGHTPEEEGKSG